MYSRVSSYMAQQLMSSYGINYSLPVVADDASTVPRWTFICTACVVFGTLSSWITIFGLVWVFKSWNVDFLSSFYNVGQNRNVSAFGWDIRVGFITIFLTQQFFTPLLSPLKFIPEISYPRKVLKTCGVHQKLPWIVSSYQMVVGYKLQRVSELHRLYTCTKGMWRTVDIAYIESLVQGNSYLW